MWQTKYGAVKRGTRFCLPNTLQRGPIGQGNRELKRILAMRRAKGRRISLSVPPVSIPASGTSRPRIFRTRLSRHATWAIPDRCTDSPQNSGTEPLILTKRNPRPARASQSSLKQHHTAHLWTIFQILRSTTASFGKSHLVGLPPPSRLPKKHTSTPPKYKPPMMPPHLSSIYPPYRIPRPYSKRKKFECEADIVAQPIDPDAPADPPCPPLRHSTVTGARLGNTHPPTSCDTDPHMSGDKPPKVVEITRIPKITHRLAQVHRHYPRESLRVATQPPGKRAVPYQPGKWVGGAHWVEFQAHLATHPTSPVPLEAVRPH